MRQHRKMIRYRAMVLKGKSFLWSSGFADGDRDCGTLKVLGSLGSTEGRDTLYHYGHAICERISTRVLYASEIFAQKYVNE